LSETIPETVHDATGLLGDAVDVTVEADVDIAPSPEELIRMIDNVLQVAQSLEVTYSRQPWLVGLPSLAHRLRQDVAPGIDRQLKSQIGISWLNVRQTANRMLDN
jgi:hypothetical protein